MRMRLHVDSVIGDEYIYPIYDIDYDKLSIMSGYSSTISPTSSQGHTICKWSVSNQTGIISRGLPATVPRYPEIDGNILPERFVYTDDVSGVLYLEHFTDPTCWQKLEAQPDDWATGTDYVKIWYNGAYRHVWAHAAGNNDSYDANNTYRDLKKMTMRVFYTENGGHFCVYKTGVYNGPGNYYPCQWGVGCVPSYNSTTQSESIYRFTSDNNQFFPSNFLIRRSTTSLTAGAAYNAVYIFVHFFISGVEYYGIAEIFYNGFGSNPVPTGLSVVGIDKSFWAENVIPGGFPGEGSWGNHTIVAGGAGDWTFPSDNRGDTTGATVAAIASQRRSALDAFFTGVSGFKIHQLLPADISDIYTILYSPQFINSYERSLYNPLSAVLSMHLLPQNLLNLSAATTSSDLIVSGYNVSSHLPTPKSYPIIPSIHSYHVGSMYIDYTDTYLDYAPYTRAWLHLPYIGVLDIDINTIAHGQIAVDYTCDAMTGNVAAYVTCIDWDGNKEIKYVSTGNAAYSMPMFSTNQDGSALGRVASSGLGLAMSALTGNAAGAGAAALNIAGGIFDAATTSRNTQITGSIGGNASMISDSRCWLEIVRPCWCEPENFQMLNGIPSQLSGTLAEYAGTGTPYVGFIRVSSVEMDGIQATDDELSEIETLLKNGIFANLPS